MSNIKGQAVLETFGIDYARMTDWIIVLNCLYLGCLLLALANLFLRMPRAKAMRQHQRHQQQQPAAASKSALGV